MRRFFIYLSLLLVLVVGIAGAIYYYWQGTPRYALAQIVVAVQTQDKDKLFRYIDLPSIIGNLASKGSDDFNVFGTPAPGSATPEDDFTRVGRALGKKLAQFLVPKVVEALEPQIKDQVGQFLANLGTREKVAITGLLTQARITTTEGGLAEVVVRDPQSKHQFSFQMLQDPQSRDWRVVEISYQDFKKYLNQFTQ